MPPRWAMPWVSLTMGSEPAARAASPKRRLAEKRPGPPTPVRKMRRFFGGFSVFGFRFWYR